MATLSTTRPPVKSIPEVDRRTGAPVENPIAPQWLQDLLPIEAPDPGPIHDLDIVALVETTTSSLAAPAHTRGIDLAVEVRSETPVILRGHAESLRLLISLLVADAIVRTRGGNILVSAFGEPLDDGTLPLNVTIRDTAQQLKKSPPYVWRGRNTARSAWPADSPDIGRAVAIRDWLLESLGANIKWECPDGGGNRCRLELELTTGRVPSKKPESAGSDLAGKRVVIQGARGESRRLVEKHLRQAGCRITDVEEAVSPDTIHAGVLVDDPSASARRGGNHPVIDLPLSGIPWLVLIPTASHIESYARFAAITTLPVKRSQLLDALDRALDARPEPRPIDPPRKSTGRPKTPDRPDVLLHVETLITSTMDDHDFAAELLHRFASDSETRLTQMTEALDRDDPAAAARMAHTIRGSALSLGLNRSGDVADRIESAILGGETGPQRVSELVDELGQVLRKTRDAIDTFVSLAKS